MSRSSIVEILEKSTGSLGLFLHRVNSAIILLLMLMVSLDVFMRYVFTSSIQWAFEVSEYIMAAVVFLSIAYIQAQKGHIMMEVLVSRLAEKKRVAIRIFTNFFVFILFAVVTWKISSVTLELFRENTLSSTSTPMPLFYSHGVIALGCLAFSLQMIIDIVLDIARLTKRTRS